MHSTYLLSVLLAAGALAGPLVERRGVPNGVKHVHRHMALHQHVARDEDTPAEEFINELESLGMSDPEQGGSSQSSPANDQPQVQVVVVTETLGAASSSSSPSPTPTPASNVVVTPENKIVLPAVPQPGSQAPAASPSTPVQQSAASPVANAAGGLPSAPSDFVDGLTGDDPVYKALVLLHHNIHRANHSLAPLSWNDTLFDLAKASAQTCVYEHTKPTPPYGQNIAAGNAPGNVSADITNGFYNGEIGLFVQALGGSYGGNSPDMSDFEHWGHATQMLWKETTSVACYTAQCFPAGQQDSQACKPDGSPYLVNTQCGNGGVRAYNLVCNYYPPGNYANSYSNVPASDSSMDFVEMTGNGVIGLPSNL